MKKLLGLFFVVLFLSCLNSLKAANCTALANGNWTTATNWDCGHVPSNGDNAIIPAGITVTINSVVNSASDVILMYISGTLTFASGNLIMAAGSGGIIYIGGKLTNSSGSSSIKIGVSVVWTNAYGNFNGYQSYGSLPVTLLNFSADYDAHTSAVTIKWSTAQEQNNSHFILEKSYDALVFEPLKWIEGAGNSYKAISYSYEDWEDKTHPTVYYRLSQYDIDGTATLSPSISIETGHLFSCTFPNPSSTENLFVSLLNISSVEIIDMNGTLKYKNVITESSKVISGNELSLSPGIYKIILVAKDQTISYKTLVVI